LTELLHRIIEKPADMLFIGILVLSLMLAAGSVISKLTTREEALNTGGARKIDLPLVRGQISDGNLSDRKALYFRKAPR
jgi:hypothetical protein